MVSTVYILDGSLIIQLPTLVNELESSLAAKSGQKLFDVPRLICYNPAYCSFSMGKSQNSGPAESSEGEDSQALSPLGLFFKRRRKRFVMKELT
jgi:hypothetical protein